MQNDRLQENVNKGAIKKQHNTTVNSSSQRNKEDETYTNGTTNGTIDAAFKKIQRNATGFLIWRIENMNVIALPKDQYGTFYDADSYIIYAASLYGQPIGMDAVSREIRGGSIEVHVHFWLGASTTPDKSGVAAYKTVELDNYIGGGATQHRETQGNESPRFKSYFKNGIKILKGGTEIGFRQIASIKFEPKLYKIKGKRTPILTQLESVDWKHFNSGDVFLLHTPNVLFVWVGRTSNPVEKLHSTKAAMQLKNEFNIPNVVFVDDGYEMTLHEDERKELNLYLSLDKRIVLPAEEGGDDEEMEKQHRSNIKLYRCSDNSGKYRVTEVKTGPILQTDLDSDDVFILDHGINGIWVWVGKRASEKERTEALRNARGFVKKKKYPNQTNVTRVVDSAEPLEFKMLFLSWKDKEETKGFGKTHTVGKVAKVAVTKFDAALMHDRPVLAAESQLLDDGSGTTKIWRIKRFEAIEVAKERHGTFYAGDCYIIWYNYSTTSGQKYVIYYWLGLHATQEEMGTAALKTVEKDDELGGVAVQGRVVQGHEPAHFLQLFKGKMMTFRGKGTDYDESGRNSKGPAHYLLQVIGTTTFNTKATQVHCQAASLNSNHCFVLKKNKCYVWCGSNSTGDQREMAKRFATKDFDLVLEGKEKSEFWDCIGGKGPYTTVKLMSDDGDSRPARLFQCSTASGTFKAEEIFNFVQTDLVPEDVMLLDAHDTIFIWIGNLSTKEERKLSLQTASEYLETDPAGRNIRTPIIQIKQGNEPPTFTGFFGVWDNSLWKEHKSFEELRVEIEGSNTSLIRKERNGIHKQKSGYNNFDQYQKYPIPILKGNNDKLPSKIDPQHKELHLTHDDFVSIFKMKYADFEILPKWKQQELKKKFGLF